MAQLINLIRKDQLRFKYYHGPKQISQWVTFSYRIGNYLCYKKGKGFFYTLLFRIYHTYYKFVNLITGIQLPLTVQAGGGLLFPHYSCIVFSGDVFIGNNVTIHQGVTIGKIHGGKKNGSPVIGNNVIIYPNCNICGKLHIGNNVVIGANSVVLKDIPDNCFVAGSPAKVISNDTFSILGEIGRKIYWCES